MERLTLTTDSTRPEIIDFLSPAANDSEKLKALVAEVEREGKRVFGEGFTIRLDETSMSRSLNRVWLYVPDWDN